MVKGQARGDGRPAAAAEAGASGRGKESKHSSSSSSSRSRMRKRVRRVSASPGLSQDAIADQEDVTWRQSPDRDLLHPLNKAASPRNTTDVQAEFSTLLAILGKRNGKQHQDEKEQEQCSLAGSGSGASHGALGSRGTGGSLLSSWLLPKEEGGKCVGGVGSGHHGPSQNDLCPAAQTQEGMDSQGTGGESPTSRGGRGNTVWTMGLRRRKRTRPVTATSSAEREPPRLGTQGRALMTAVSPPRRTEKEEEPLQALSGAAAAAPAPAAAAIPSTTVQASQAAGHTDAEDKAVSEDGFDIDDFELSAEDVAVLDKLEQDAIAKRQDRSQSTGPTTLALGAPPRAGRFADEPLNPDAPLRPGGGGTGDGGLGQRPLNTQARKRLAEPSLEEGSCSVSFARFLVLEVVRDGARREVRMACFEERMAQGSSIADLVGGGGVVRQQHREDGPGDLGGRRRTIVLRGDWYNSSVDPGDMVHVVCMPLESRKGGELASAQTDLVVDNEHNLLVVIPDILVSPSRVSDSVGCDRSACWSTVFPLSFSQSLSVVLFKQVLKSRLPSLSSGGRAAVMGILKHELFQKGLALGASPPGGGGGGDCHTLRDKLTGEADGVIRRNLETIYTAGLDDVTAKQELCSVIPAIVTFTTAFTGEGVQLSGGKEARGFGSSATASKLAPERLRGRPCTTVQLATLVAVEENIWSTTFGMKGFLDATVTVRLRRGRVLDMPPVLQHKENSKSGSMCVPQQQQRQALGKGAQEHHPPKQSLQQGPSLSLSAEERLVVMPLELKTGKKSAMGQAAHRAQVMLYTLMLQGRYGQSKTSTSGLLVYLGEGDVQVDIVEPQWSEVRSLLMARNRHASSLFKMSIVSLRLQGVGTGLVLPPVIKDAFACARCFQNTECMLYHRSLEGGSLETSGLKEQDYDEKVGHLKPSHLLYFSQWDRMVDLEGQVGESLRRSVWQQSGPMREAKTGMCVASLQLSGIEAEGEGMYVHTFRRSPVSRPQEDGGGGSDAQISPPPLDSFKLSVGDRVIVSAEGSVCHASRSASSTSAGGLELGSPHRHFCLLSTQISALSSSTIELKSSRILQVPMLSATGSVQPYRVSSDVEDIGAGAVSSGLDTVVDINRRILFRIDKDEFTAGISLMRHNLARLMVGPTPKSSAALSAADRGAARPGSSERSVEEEQRQGDEKRRRLVVDLDTPQFGPFKGLFAASGSLASWVRRDPSDSAQLQSEAAKAKLRREFDEVLNEDQRAAVRKVLSARDYALLLGMPGTGKTTTIAYLTRLLVARGQSVLITSYTHSGVDNLLLKLLEEGVPCLRIGNVGSVHPGVKHCLLGETLETTTEYHEVLMRAKVVGVTCLGIRHPLFGKRNFDVCIVDEAGQISQPTVLGPLRSADVFVLVGDHYQLPPLVSNEEAQEEGMNVSLFRRLSETHPSALQHLSYQYRMNSDIMSLCNQLIYCNALKCGNAKVAQRCLLLPSPENLLPPAVLSGVEQQHWLKDVLEPGKRVVFMDTDALSYGEGEGAAQGGRFCSLEQKQGVPRPGSEAGGGGGGGGGGGCDPPGVGVAGRHGKRGASRGSLVNRAELDIILLCVSGLLRAGLDGDAIGVICPYRSQVRAFEASAALYPGVEFNTIDKYQGRDKDVILVSLVRSNDAGNVGNLLRDWTRINVALSRAKQKLLLVGSLSTLEHGAFLSSLTGLLRRQEWIYTLPRGAHSMYPALLPKPKPSPRPTAGGTSGARTRVPATAGGGVLNRPKHAMLREISQEAAQISSD